MLSTRRHSKVEPRPSLPEPCGGGPHLGHLADASADLYPGTFTVRGKTVLIELDDAHGTTTFRWDRVPDGAGERLELTFTDTTVKSLHSAPAEVFLRMWSVAPFWEPQPLEPSLC